MKVLVTGATGFLGKNILPLLVRSGAELAVITRNAGQSQLANEKNISVIEGHLENLSEVENQILKFNPDCLLHLAWDGIPDYSAAVSKKNLDLSVRLVDLLMDQTSCQKFVVSGSCFEYGKASGAVTEETPEGSPSYIAWAKNSLKNYLSLRCSEKQRDWAWLRVFYVFGPGQRLNSLIPTLVTSYAQGHSPAIRNPNNANDFIYVDDVARAFAYACLNSHESGVFNIGSGSLLKVSRIMQLVQESLAGQTSQAVQNTDAIGCYANIQKAKSFMKWTPQCNVEERIKDFTQYLLKTGAP